MAVFYLTLLTHGYNLPTFDLDMLFNMIPKRHMSIDVFKLIKIKHIFVSQYANHISQMFNNHT